MRDVGAVYGIAANGVSLFELAGLRKKDSYGLSLASAGDVDLDGHADIITASAKADRQDPVTMKLVKDLGVLEVISGRIATQD